MTKQDYQDGTMMPALGAIVSMLKVKHSACFGANFWTVSYLSGLTKVVVTEINQAKANSCVSTVMETLKARGGKKMDTKIYMQVLPPLIPQKYSMLSAKQKKTIMDDYDKMFGEQDYWKKTDEEEVNIAVIDNERPLRACAGLASLPFADILVLHDSEKNLDFWAYEQIYLSAVEQFYHVRLQGLTPWTDLLINRRIDINKDVFESTLLEMTHFYRKQCGLAPKPDLKISAEWHK